MYRCCCCCCYTSALQCLDPSSFMSTISDENAPRLCCCWYSRTSIAAVCFRSPLHNSSMKTQQGGAMRRPWAIVSALTAMMVLCCSVGQVGKATAFSTLASRRTTTGGKTTMSASRGYGYSRGGVSLLARQAGQQQACRRPLPTQHRGGVGVAGGRRGKSGLKMMTSSEDEDAEEEARAEVCTA